MTALTVTATIAELAESNGVSPRTMNRRLAVLRGVGQLDTQRRGPRGARRTFRLTAQRTR